MKPKPLTKPRDPWALRAVEPVGLHEAIDHCAAAFGTTRAAMSTQLKLPPGPQRRADVVAYQVTCYVARQVTGASYPVIARALGRREHTAIIRACDSVLARMPRDYGFRMIVKRLIRELTPEKELAK